MRNIFTLSNFADAFFCQKCVFEEHSEFFFYPVNEMVYIRENDEKSKSIYEKRPLLAAAVSKNLIFLFIVVYYVILRHACRYVYKTGFLTLET